MTSKYLGIRDTLNTGDIVLFSGRGFVSTAIKCISCSKWSHVGMVVKSAELGAVLLWETTTLSKIKDINFDDVRQGVQLVPLSERIRQYEGEIAVRKLQAERSPFMLRQLALLREEVKGRPYEDNYLELVRSVYDGAMGENEEDLSSLFCSELIAEAYQRMGLLHDADLPSNELTPADFSSARGLVDARLLGNTQLLPELRVK